MNFLDVVPQDWTKAEFRQLRDLFVQAYWRPAAIEALARVAGIVPGTFPIHDNMRTTCTELIQVMGNQKKLRALVELAAADATIDAYQQRFVEMLQGTPDVPAPMPIPPAGWWKGDDPNPVITRTMNHERLLAQRSRFIPIDIAHRISEASHSVAKLTLRFDGEEAHGTGFLIQPDLLLTNHHNMVHPTHGAVQGVTAEFDYEERFIGAGLVCKGDINSIVSHQSHDWAVIRLEHPVDRPPLVLGTAYDVGKNGSVIIIQHPIGAFKQFAVDMLSIRHVDDEHIQYLADTQSGSSGSPVFSIKMDLIALHHMEVETVTTLAGEQTVEWRNQGIRIEQVMQDLTAANIPFLSRTARV